MADIVEILRWDTTLRRREGLGGLPEAFQDP
jgi:hypothetical protein